MGKLWVLDTETKGTGANMVPLERILRKPGSDAVQEFVLPELRGPSAEEEPRQPHAFKVIDVMTREVLGEGIDARATVELLEDVRSIVDVTIYTWEAQTERWRMLTFGETKLLWEHRGQLQLQADPSAAG